MTSFEDLGVAPELIEALAAEGIEECTPLQEAAIPILRRGNNLVLEAGPGSGLLVAWLLGLLDGVEAGGSSPAVLVACADAETAGRLAESTARLTSTTGHRVAALGGAWTLPHQADILFGDARDLREALATGDVSPGACRTVVVDQAHLIESFLDLELVERILDFAPDDCQRILSALPMTPAVSDLVGRLFKRTMTVPTPEEPGPDRGQVRFRIAPEPREVAALQVVQEVLSDGARHALVYCRSEDRAADVGDLLTLHGFTAGAPGDESLPVWLGLDALDARRAARDIEGVVVVSCDCPPDPDTLDRRHSLGEPGVVVVLPREVPHLRALGRRTGYDTVPFPPQPSPNTPMAQLRATLEAAVQERDTSPYLVALEPLFEKHGAETVAAAAVALLRQGLAEKLDADVPGGSVSSTPAQTGKVPSWAKLFISIGERDGLRVGDLLGAVTGEANVSGDAVGKIDIKESHSLVEVHDTVARKVINALNGTTIKGRSARVDFDRPRGTSKKPRR